MTQTDGEVSFEEAVRHATQSGITIDGSLPGDETDIAALERRLNVRLPPSYKAMVRLYGNVSFDAVEIYGLTKVRGLDAKGIPNVVFATEDDRQRGIIGPGMVRFMDAGYGPTFILDCSEADEFGEAPVYEVATGGIAVGRDKLAVSFGHFIFEEVKNLSET